MNLYGQTQNNQNVNISKKFDAGPSSGDQEGLIFSQNEQIHESSIGEARGNEEISSVGIQNKFQNENEERPDFDRQDPQKPVNAQA